MEYDKVNQEKQLANLDFRNTIGSALWIHSSRDKSVVKWRPPDNPLVKRNLKKYMQYFQKGKTESIWSYTLNNVNVKNTGWISAIKAE